MTGDKSVLVGMSGGIDSTAVCCMLLEEGHRVEGLTFITCDAGVAAAEAAARLAGRLGIPHHVADVRERFAREVVEPFVAGYLSGFTPNPCVNCNPNIKFALLEEYADRLGCAHIATGHYVRKEQRAKRKEERFYIVAGDDFRKDQSYFLWRLTQQQLSRVIFPLGGMEKTQVVEYLKQRGYSCVASGGESMEVCFIPGDYRDFLRESVADIDARFAGGSFVDNQGRVLGRHAGFPFFTIGQRKGLGIALGYPAYVTKINPVKNTVMLGREEELLASYMLVDTPQWVDGVPDGLSVRVRYRSAPVRCDVPREVDDGRWLVRLHEKVSAITPGQSAVFYVGNMVVGGAFISQQRGINQWIDNSETI